MAGNTCSCCGVELSRRILQKVAAGRPTTGLCAKCWRDDVRRERHCCECGKKIANRKAKRCQPCSNRRMALDKDREARRLAAADQARLRPDVQARRKEANRRVAARKMAWCPVERRAEYFKLLRIFGARAEAKRIIEDSMTPLERQVSRVMAGAAVVPKMKLRPPEPQFTLGGVTGAIL